MGRAAADDVGDASWDRVGERTVDAYQRHLLHAAAA